MWGTPTAVSYTHLLPGCEAVTEDKKAYAEAAKVIHGSNDPFNPRPFIQATGNRYLCQNPPQMPLTEAEMDEIYGLPYT